MISRSITASSLVTLLALIHLIRLYLLLRFKTEWTRFKADIILSTSSCTIFAVLTGLFWANKAPVGRQVLLQLSAVPTTLQMVCFIVLSPFECGLRVSKFLRIDFQQRRHPTLPGWVLILCPVLAVLSSISKVVVTIIGRFYWDNLRWGNLYILCLDYLGVALWYWRLVGQVLVRRRQQMIALYVSCLALLLLASAAIGTVWKLWIIALEVSLIW
jgi:hypothetical protein